jgi:hypothetical protein
MARVARNDALDLRNAVRALHPPKRHEVYDTSVHCGGLCWDWDESCDADGREVGWPCPTAALVYTPDEIAAQERYTLEAKAYAEDVARAHRRAEAEKRAEHARQTDALMAAHRLDTNRIKDAYERGALASLALDVDPEKVKAFLHAVQYREAQR